MVYTNEPLAYVRMTTAQADAELGKLAAGQVIELPHSKAIRWDRIGVGVLTTEDEYRAYREQAAAPVGVAAQVVETLSAESGLRAVFAHLMADGSDEPDEPDAPDEAPPAKLGGRRRK